MKAASSKNTIDQPMMRQFEILFHQCFESYPATEGGQRHIQMYDESRRQARKNYEDILQAADRGEDVTDRVLLQLLPYDDSPSNRDKGAWIPLAPAIRGDLKKWYEKKGWIQAHQWPQVAQAILDFFRRCNSNPEELQAACKAFADLPYTRGFQTGMLTPMLNALRPDEFLLINNKSRRAINHFAGSSYGQKLSDYPETNATGWELIDELAPLIRQSDVPALRDADLFDMFSHWLVAVKDFELEPVHYWKIAPGRDAWHWEACRENGFIAIGWDELGDLSQMTTDQFDARCKQLASEHDEWTERGMNQAWTFAQIREGDYIVANHGISEVLGIGRVIGPYYYAEGERHSHRYLVAWEDTTPRKLHEEEHGWRRALVELDRDKFESIRDACPGGYFTERTFDLLEDLHRDPTTDFYTPHKDDFDTHVIGPFKQLFHDVADSLPSAVTDVMETERRLFSRIPKNDYGRGGAWESYWGALYPKGSKRTADVQLLAWINYERLAFGFYIGDYASEPRQLLLHRCRDHRQALKPLLQHLLTVDDFVFDRHKNILIQPDGTVVSKLDLTWEDWLEHPEQADFGISVVIPCDQVLTSPKADLVHRIAQAYQELFPLILLRTESDPLPAITEYVASAGYMERGDAQSDLVRCLVDMQDLLQKALSARGLQYSDWQIATFYTALQTKGFVILSGISGTGKTKLAQAFSDMLPQPAEPQVEARDDVISITVQPYMPKYNRLIIPKHFTKLYEPPPPGESKKVELTFGNHSQTCRLQYADYASTNYIALYLRGDASPWFSETFDPGDTVVLEPRSDEDGRLLGFHIGKPSDPAFLAQAPARPPSNSLFVPVRTDWRDSKSLLGYYNPLTGTYEWTDFLRFVLRAVQCYRQRDGLAWLVILDEMNLAHVEYYFADLLSVLESGRDAEGWTRESVRLPYPSDAEGDLPPSQVKLPPNLYVIGTVNVDETTHTFSPKVLDRAFTLELTEADFSNYPPDPSEAPRGELAPTERRSILANFTQEGQFARIDKSTIAEYVAHNGDVRDRLEALNDQLRPYHLHLGYRVFDEIVSFLVSAEANDLYPDRDVAFDAAVLMKVLPKFHGLRGKLEEPLKRVLAWCLLPDDPDYETVDQVLKQADDTDAAIRALNGQPYQYKRTAAKACRMLRELYTSGFASFS